MEQLVNEDAYMESTYGDDGEDASSSYWETSKEDTTDKSISYARRQNMMKVQSFAKKNKAIVPIQEDEDDTIENEVLSSLVEYDATEEQVFEEKVQVLLEEDLISYGWEGGSDMFDKNGDLVGDTFDGVLWEMESLPMDVGSNERVLRIAYVDDWLGAQVWQYGKVLQMDGGGESQMFDPGDSKGSQVANTKDLEAREESEQSHEDGQAFMEQPVNEDADMVSTYGDDGEDASSSCWETSKEDRANESTSYGKEIEPDEPELVKVKLPNYVFEHMIVANVQEEQRIEQVKEDEDDAIENEFLSSLVEYDATEEQVFEEQVIEADKPVVLINLEGPIDEEELEDASIDCMIGKEESKESKVELPMLQVCSMTAIEHVQVLLEEDLISYGWEGGSDMFDENGDLVGDTFDGVLWEMESLPIDAGSNERVLRTAYVDDWLGAQWAGESAPSLGVVLVDEAPRPLWCLALVAQEQLPWRGLLYLQLLSLV
ncbi:hypothetical protein L7F22_010270 [Adiantum nelumboides]|nr:hypothetical protein [Adiantum nelumboides]